MQEDCQKTQVTQGAVGKPSHWDFSIVALFQKKQHIAAVDGKVYVYDSIKEMPKGLNKRVSDTGSYF